MSERIHAYLEIPRCRSHDGGVGIYLVEAELYEATQEVTVAAVRGLRAPPGAEGDEDFSRWLPAERISLYERVREYARWQRARRGETPPVEVCYLPPAPPGARRDGSADSQRGGLVALQGAEERGRLSLPASASAVLAWLGGLCEREEEEHG